MSRLRLSALTLVAALTFTFSLSSRAQEAAIAVSAVPAPAAKPLILEPIDDSKVAPLNALPIPSAKDLGRVSPTMPMAMELVLRRSTTQQRALGLLEKTSHDPSNPQFGKTLTPAEFARAFGLAGSDLQTITSWLTGKGFEVVSVDNGRLAIMIRGTAAQVETAFHTDMHQYEGADGMTHYANATAPQFPKAMIRLVAGLYGIDNFKPMQLRGFAGPVTDFATGTVADITPLSSAPKVAPAVKLQGEALRDASFTASTYSMIFGHSAQLNVRLGGDTHPATGSLLITDNHGNSVAYVADISTCEPYNGAYGRSCNLDFKPSFAGTSTLSATYSGNDHFKGSIQQIIIAHAGPTPSYSVILEAPPMFYSGTATLTFTTVISYAGSVAPTGTYTVTVYDLEGFEDVAFTPVNLTTCTPTAADNLLTCTGTATGTQLSNNLEYYTDAQFDVEYNGDTNYAASVGFTDGYFTNVAAGTYTPSLTVQGSFAAAETYGTATNEPGVTGFTEVPATGGSDPGYYKCNAEVNFTGPLQLGSLAYFGGLDEGCTSKTASCVTTFGGNQITLPSVVTPGTYTITTVYSGDTYAAANASCNNNPVNSTTALSVLVNKQTPVATMTTAAYATPAPVTTQTADALAPFLVYGTLAWTGVGVPPVVGDVSFTSTAGGTFSTPACTLTYTNARNILAATPYKCSSTFTPTSTDAPGSYNNNLKYTTDGVNYNATVSTTTGNYIINAPVNVTPTLSLTPQPVTSVYAATTDQTVTATLTGITANGTTAGAAVTVTVNSTYGALSLTAGATTGTSSVTCTTVLTTSPASSCPVYFIPNGSTAVGTYTGAFSATAAAIGYYNAVTTAVTDSLKITQAAVTISLVAATPGTKTLGVLSTTLTATLTPAFTGVTVSFVDAASGVTLTGVTGSSGASTGVATLSATGTVAGLNNYTAGIAGTTNYTAATSAVVPVYYAGILFSTSGKHNFSGLITDQGQTVEGTLDGTQLGPYGVTVFNFTTTTQALNYTAPSTVTPVNDAAFSYTQTCGATLASGATCDYEYYYNPPYGDGCTLGGTGSGGCTMDNAPAPGPYPQGTYEQASWNVGTPDGVLVGIGDTQFDRYGAVVFPGTLAGKAILSQGTLSVTPTSYAFGAWTSGTTSNTLTVVVSNSSSSPVAFTFTGTATPQFTVTSNTCVSPLGANAECNIYITFESPNPASYADSITIQPTGDAAITVNMTGTVETKSGLQITTNNHNFGNISTGTTATFAFGVTNNSGTAQPVTLTYPAAAGYTVNDGCPASPATLGAGSGCSITVTFAPTAAGAVSESLSIASNTFIVPGGTTSAPYTDTLTLSGTGVAGGQFTATSVGHNFGAVNVGVSAGNYGLELSNNTASTVTFNLGAGFINGTNGFALQGSSCNSGSLAPNSTCELIFSFDPTATGFVSATYGISSSATLYSGGAAVNPEQISLSGTGQN